MNLANNIDNSLDAKLDNAFGAWAAENFDQRQDVVNKLQSFINAVEAQRGKKIPDASATSLEKSALDLITVTLDGGL